MGGGRAHGMTRTVKPPEQALVEPASEHCVATTLAAHVPLAGLHGP